MSDGAKQLHMRKVFSRKPILLTKDAEPPSLASRVISVSVGECGITNVAQSTLQGIWNKAESLVQSDGHVIKAPWVSEISEKFIFSTASPCNKTS